MKKLLCITSILMFFFIGCSFKNFHYVKVSTDQKKTEKKFQSLIGRYMEYWECMSNKDFRCAYQYEMPHQRFLHDLQWYKRFNSGNNSHYKTVLLKIEPKNKHLVIIKSKYISADNKVTYVFHDKWYNVNGTWYHKMKVSLFPFGESED